jgi:hypothetical protein
MVSIRLPIPYTVHMHTERNGKPNRTTASGVEIGTFTIPEYELDEIKVVATWEQKWGQENRIGHPPLFDSEPDEWKKAFQASPAMNRLIMIGDQFYSPLKQSLRNEVGTYLTTDGNFLSAMIASTQTYETVICQGAVSTYFGKSSAYQTNLQKSGYSHNDPQPVKPSTKGKQRDGDTLEHVREAMQQVLASFALIDGMLWVPISEPSLRLASNTTEATLAVSHGPSDASYDHAMFFSLSDFDIAVDILSSHFDHDKIRIDVADIRIVHAENLQPSMEYDEAVRGVRRFFSLTRSSVPTYSKQAGSLWFGLKELLGDGIASEQLSLSEDKMESAVDMVEKMAGLLPAEKVSDERDRDRAVALAKIAVDRWRLRPVEAAPTKGMSL